MSQPFIPKRREVASDLNPIVTSGYFQYVKEKEKKPDEETGEISYGYHFFVKGVANMEIDVSTQCSVIYLGKDKGVEMAQYLDSLDTDTKIQFAVRPFCMVSRDGKSGKVGYMLDTNFGRPKLVKAAIDVAK